MQTFGDFLVSEWLPAVKSTIRATTFTGYTNHVRLHLCPRLGALKLDELDGQTLNRFYASLLAKGLSPTSVRLVHATIRCALRDAMKWGLVSENVALSADPPRRANVEMKVW